MPSDCGVECVLSGACVMTRHLNLENAIFVQCAAQRLAELGHSPAEIFRAVPFGQSLVGQEEPFTDSRSIASFFQHAAKISEIDLFGLRFGQQTDLRKAGLLGYLALCAPQVLGFLSNLSDYARLFGEALHFDRSQLAETGALTWTYAVDAGTRPEIRGGESRVRTSAPDTAGIELSGQYVEFLVALILSNLRRSSQTRIRLRQVAFCHHRLSGAAEMEEFFGCRVQFGAPENLLRFETDDLTRELATGDPILLRILLQCAASQMKTMMAGERDIASQVEQSISRRLASGTAALETVAQDLGMSPRTLSRKLGDQGTSYFEILEKLREEMATQYLLHSELVLAEIAHLLGYRGLSSFNDAFKRWTGKSPGKFRSGS